MVVHNEGSRQEARRAGLGTFEQQKMPGASSQCYSEPGDSCFETRSWSVAGAGCCGEAGSQGDEISQ